MTSASSAAAVFETLPGSWAMTRVIPGRGRLNGEVVFTPLSPTQLRYDETGLLELDQIAETFTATRSYLYELREDHLFIFYNDGDRAGEVLHELIFDTGTGHSIASHCHVCASDTYDLTMSLESETRIEMHYAVTGPHKNYTMETVLTRQISADPSSPV